MDLRFTEQEQAFRAEVREWLAEHLRGDYAQLGAAGGPGGTGGTWGGGEGGTGESSMTASKTPDTTITAATSWL